MVEVAVRRAADGVWTSSRPLAALLSKPWYPLVVVVLMLAVAASMAANLRLIAGRGLVQGRAFRFTPLAARGGPEIAAAVSSVGLLADGCELASPSAGGINTTAAARGAVTLAFAQPVAVNGWRFDTWDGSPAVDPVSFLMERSATGSGSDWAVMGGSSVTWTWSGESMYASGPYPSSLALMNLNIKGR